ncbi:G-type lectin S-receptor-like serine/threonine-protein kinase At2g19130 [Impatiens glandulifera]|uniref:G-type lectin S-receptor-like serine/threonine-protein kinase At2g19130 n=1 Tax=Impatiens glandulifera TaxID=253017 RepID=UPI001FB1084F|nr:G-type lectin S-receptor-like serine/threonine-protein kinase At2g19130 [Impatiens glandulifera]
MYIMKNNIGFFFYVLICFFFCSQHGLSHGAAANTISANQTLSGDQTIVSAGGIFALGFFRPGKDSNKNYIGIWYNNLPITQTVVWVANRDNPISDRYSSQLRILHNNLALLNESQTPIWSTNISSSSSSSSPIEATLGDDGNFVLKDMSNSTVWQSFDYPVHTWLPGAKLSYNKRTQTRQSLISWKNSEDPSTGLFSFEIEEKKNQYFIRRNRSEKYWNSGPWNGKHFSLLPEMNLGFLFNYSYVNNENESYFTFNMYNPKTICRAFMDVTGQLRVVTWVDGVGWNLYWNQPTLQCEVYALCGGNGVCNQITQQFCNCLEGFHPKSQDDWNLNDLSGGCVRNFDLQCGNIDNNKRKDGFKLFTNMRLPGNPMSLPDQMDIKTCASSCLNDCSCSAYSYHNNLCSVWNAELLNLQQLAQNEGDGRSIYIRLAAEEFEEFASSKRSAKKTTGVVIGSVGVVIVLGIVILLILRRKKRSNVEGFLVAFMYRDLQRATKNFSEKLGGGGFGSVFKGTLPDSTLIAVKRLDSISQGEKQFRTEVSTIGNVQHVNLVRLHGFCSQGIKKLLVYEYMQNGSLDSILFRPNDSKSILDWKTRYQIAIGIARGLAYLHEKCRDCIVHCDIKPENILLDAGFCPKVADFGLAKLMGRDFSRVLTSMRGTIGYLAPEWISGVAITAKADVYSYGLMLFELISGRRNFGDGRMKYFPIWAANVALEGGDIMSLLDARLDRESAEPEEVMRVCRVACWCIQDWEGHRPTMGQVVQVLEGVIDVEQPPVPRVLQNMVEDDESLVFFEEISFSSSNKTAQAHDTSSGHSHTKSISSSKELGGAKYKPARATVTRVALYSLCVEEVSEKYDIEIPQMEARYKSSRSRFCQQNDSITVKHHYQFDVFIAGIDFQIEELNSKFKDEAVELLKLSGALEPKDNFKLLNVDHIYQLAEKFYHLDFDAQDLHHLRTQLAHYELDMPVNERFQYLSTIFELCRR